MPPRGRPAPAVLEPTPVEQSQLAESVDRLTREVQSMRGELDEAREEVAWAMRALLPGKAGEAALSESQPSGGVNDELERMMTFVAEGQLEVMLVALDGVRDEIIKAVRGKGGRSDKEFGKSRSERTQQELRQRSELLETKGGGDGDERAADDSERGENGDESDEESAGLEDEHAVTIHQGCDAIDHNEQVEGVASNPSDDDALRPGGLGGSDSLDARQARHRQWCLEVRDPARERSEGLRTIATGRDEARFEYEIAPLPDGSWAVNWLYGFRCGNCDGKMFPWTTYSTREECLEEALRTARQFYSAPAYDAVQEAPKREMLKLLSSGLFGFIEPESRPR